MSLHLNHETAEPEAEKTWVQPGTSEFLQERMIEEPRIMKEDDKAVKTEGSLK